MDGVDDLDEKGKISNFLNPDAEKQTFGRKSQNWPNMRDENGILLKIERFHIHMRLYASWFIRKI
ncbi:hypothetical protein Hanom_Chr02g00158461 [Helianthus anomalus]